MAKQTDNNRPAATLRMPDEKPGDGVTTPPEAEDRAPETPEGFYKKLTGRADVREVLKRLSER